MARDAFADGSREADSSLGVRATRSECARKLVGCESRAGAVGSSVQTRKNSENSQQKKHDEGTLLCRGRSGNLRL